MGVALWPFSRLSAWPDPPRDAALFQLLPPNFPAVPQPPDPRAPGVRAIADSRATQIEILITGAQTFGVELSANQIQALTLYTEHLAAWNRRLNLTAVRDPELVIRHHLIDCISVVPWLLPTGPIMDVGSGAGLPGIPIKLLYPEKTVTLLEPRRKRANFLRHVIRTLGLSGIHVREDRLELLRPETIPPQHEMIARAFTNNNGFLRASPLLLRPDGVAIVMHGPTGLHFLEQARPGIQSLGLEALPPQSFSLPFGDERRTVLFFKKA